MSISKPLAVTMGDPAGIGLEITLKAFEQSKTLKLPPFFIVADVEAIEMRKSALKLNFNIQVLDEVNIKNEVSKDDWFKTLKVLPLKSKVKCLSPSAENAPAILESIEKAVELTHKNLAKGIVTNPIAKYILKEAGFKHAGHTEFLGELAQKYYSLKSTPIMLLWSEALAVVPITIHIALKDVPAALTQNLIIETVKTAVEDYAKRFNVKNPRVAFCGLNPHAGDEGMMGLEDELVVKPAAQTLKEMGFCVQGVFAADTLFHARARKNYDLAFGMYHDQVLIPMKTLAFDEGVNVTLGLPFLRTSPDHGTAFDIAGKGIARETSFVEALKLAGRLA